jgi:hypothetical protein
MIWARKFDRPIALKDGRVIATLADARAFIHSRPEIREYPVWQRAAELLLDAATGLDERSIHVARAQLTRALKAEALIRTSR